MHPASLFSPMRVQVVRIGHVGVGVAHRVVLVPMAVRAPGHRVVVVQVVAVVVGVGVLVRVRCGIELLARMPPAAV